MLRRFLLLGMCASIGSAASASQSALVENRAGRSQDQIRLACTGTMMTAGQPAPGPIVSTGVIDFQAQLVRGFGMGSQPILILTVSEIDFGSEPSDSPSGTIVEGSINRQSGATRIVLRSARAPDAVLIESVLKCEFEHPVS